MKKATLFVVSLIMFGFINAQTGIEENELFQSVFKMEKKDVVSAFVKVDDAQKDAFWKLYDAYEVERKVLAKKRIELFIQYAKNYDKMTSEVVAPWTEEVIKLSNSTDKLIVTYYRKISKATNPVTAFQFFQIEYFCLTEIRSYILHDIPFIQAKQ